MLKRMVGFAYGAICYLIFFGTFLYAIGFVGGGNLYGAGKSLIVPRSIDLSSAGPGEPFAQRLIIDALLLSLFAIQHSVMARAWFKRGWTRIVAPPLERSTYVLLASSALLLMFWQWRPIGLARIAWNVENHTGQLVLQGLFWIGWLTVLISTFLIDQASHVLPQRDRVSAADFQSARILSRCSAPDLSRVHHRLLEHSANVDGSSVLRGNDDCLHTCRDPIRGARHDKKLRRQV